MADDLLLGDDDAKAFEAFLQGEKGQSVEEYIEETIEEEIIEVHELSEEDIDEFKYGTKGDTNNDSKTESREIPKKDGTTKTKLVDVVDLNDDSEKDEPIKNLIVRNDISKKAINNNDITLDKSNKVKDRDNDSIQSNSDHNNNVVVSSSEDETNKNVDKLGNDINNQIMKALNIIDDFKFETPFLIPSPKKTRSQDKKETYESKGKNKDVNVEKATKNIEQKTINMVESKNRSPYAQSTVHTSKPTTPSRPLFTHKPSMLKSPGLFQKPNLSPKQNISPKSTISPKQVVNVKSVTPQKTVVVGKSSIVQKPSLLPKHGSSPKTIMFPPKPSIAPKSPMIQRSPIIQKPPMVPKPTMIPKPIIEKSDTTEQPPKTEKSEASDQSTTVERIEESDKSSILERPTRVEKMEVPDDETYFDEIDKKELDWFKRHGAKVEHIGTKALNCTACGKQCNGMMGTTRHPLLGVTICLACRKFYKDGSGWRKDEEGYDVYCRWCGQGGELILCDKCTASFCKRCLQKNLGRKKFADITLADEWQCLICDPSQIYEQKAIYYAIYLHNREPSAKEKDKAKEKESKESKDSNKENRRDRLARERVSVNDIISCLPKDGKEYPANKFINENIDEAFKTLDVYLKCLKHEQTRWTKTGRKITDRSAVTPVYKSLRKIYKTCRQNMVLLDKAVTQSFIEYFPEDEDKIYFEDEVAAKDPEDDADPKRTEDDMILKKSSSKNNDSSSTPKSETKQDGSNKSNTKAPIKPFLPCTPTKPTKSPPTKSIYLPTTPNNKAPSTPISTPKVTPKESSIAPSPKSTPKENKSRHRPPRKRPSKPINPPPSKVSKPSKPIDDDSDIEIVDIDD